MTEQLVITAPPAEIAQPPREAERQPDAAESSRELLASLPDFIRQLKERCDQVAGLDELPVLVDRNIRSQLEIFDAASSKLRQDSVTLIPLYGLFRQVTSDQEIIGFIRQMRQDIDTIAVALRNRDVDVFYNTRIPITR